MIINKGDVLMLRRSLWPHVRLNIKRAQNGKEVEVSSTHTLEKWMIR